MQANGGAMTVYSGGAVTFNGNSNVMQSNTAPINQGQSIHSTSTNLKFSVCIPGTPNTPGTYSGNVEIDLEKCVLEVCSWSDISGNDIGNGTYSVPAPGCKMKKKIDVKVDVTIEGVSGSYRELQSNRIDNQGVAASPAHRHFNLQLPGKLTLNYLKLTWGEVGGSSGGFIFMTGGTLAINWVHFDGTETSGLHAQNGGCIIVALGTVTIKKSTFEGFRAKRGGALSVYKTPTAMTIESTTFKNNAAIVRLIFSGFACILLCTRTFNNYVQNISNHFLFLRNIFLFSLSLLLLFL